MQGSNDMEMSEIIRRVAIPGSPAGQNELRLYKPYRDRGYRLGRSF